MKKIFHISDLLSIYFSTELSISGYVGICGLLSHMLGEKIEIANFMFLAEYCKPELVRQHPWLETIKLTGVTEKNRREWLEMLKIISAKYKEYHEVMPLLEKCGVTARYTMDNHCQRILKAEDLKFRWN
ncbi:MAG: hypothetical protein WCK37_04850 [Candidatus Falkowbacteria bacterium]